MTDPKKDESKKTDDDKVTIPPKSASPSPSPTTAPKTTSPSPSSSTTTAAAAKKAEESRTMSSVGAELHPEATTKKVDGKLALDAGGSHPAAAPQPTPAEVVLYPSTGGLPDTGPNSKYVLGTYTGPELFNRNGDRVNADGQLIDDYGNVIPEKGDVNVNPTVAADRRVIDKNMQKQSEYVSEATKAEMDAGRRALGNR